jgi:hypothetical protein
MSTSLTEFMTLTTELQAVNLGLEAIGQNPVVSLSSTDTSVDSDAALKHLGEANRDIQAEGWAWNSDDAFPIDPGVDGSIALPANILKVKQAYFDGGFNKVLVQRGLRLYDRKGHTFNIGIPVKVDIVTLLEFTDLPQEARTYIALEGASRLVFTKLVSTTASALISKSLNAARIRIEQAETDADQSTMADNPHVQATRSRRRGKR